MKQESDESQTTYFIAYRNFLGATLFSGLINKSVAKIKEINEKQNKFKVKAAVVCKDFSTRKYVPEYLEIRFSNDNDRKAFIKVFSEVAEIKNN